MLNPRASPAQPAVEQIQAEVFTLTYGAIIRQLLADLGEDNVQEVNRQLDKMWVAWWGGHLCNKRVRAWIACMQARVGAVGASARVRARTFPHT